MLKWIKRKFTRSLRQWPRLKPAEIRKRSRILVIDDADFAYLSLLYKDGYTVEKWNDVADLTSLEDGAYDLVLLDIHGVGTMQSRDEGLGILRHLKSQAPAQAVIAYSGADFSLKYKEFFDLADIALAKDADYVDFKKAIDDVLSRRFSLDFYVERILREAGPSVSDMEKLRQVAAEAILRQDPELLRTHLSSAGAQGSTIDRSLQVAQVGVGVFQIAMALG